ncbi:hypothetical protein FJZ18_03270 [Candidatus Pacearchaeota archaeon]|nr:hypothetical protein [Candidatus Pacearchaeota archaeon]
MSAREFSLEERTRKIEAAVNAGYIKPELGQALRDSNLIQSQIHNARHNVQEGNIPQAIQLYRGAVDSLKKFNEYVEKANLTTEQRESLRLSLADHFSTVHSLISNHPSYGALGTMGESS